MIDEVELRAEIAKAVKGEVSLAALYAWLMSRSWNMHKDSEDPAIELANSLEDLFFDKADGIINESDLRRELQSLLERDNANRVIALRIVISLAPVAQNAAAVQRIATVATPVVLPPIQVPLYAN